MLRAQSEAPLILFCLFVIFIRIINKMKLFNVIRLNIIFGFNFGRRGNIERPLYLVMTSVLLYTIGHLLALSLQHPTTEAAASLHDCLGRIESREFIAVGIEGPPWLLRAPRAPGSAIRATLEV